MFCFYAISLCLMHYKSKYIIAYLFLILFAFANTGFIVYKHSCVHCKVIKNKIFVNKSDCCHKTQIAQQSLCCLKKDKNKYPYNKGCCNNEIFVKQLNQDYNINTTQHKPIPAITSLYLFYHQIYTSNFDLMVKKLKIAFSYCLLPVAFNRQAILCVYII